MEFNAVHYVIRDALKAIVVDLPPIGSKANEYDHAAVDIMKALDDAGFTVERKP